MVACREIRRNVPLRSHRIDGGIYRVRRRCLYAFEGHLRRFKVYSLLMHQRINYSKIRPSSGGICRKVKGGTAVFGYIKPHKPELLVKEYELYKCVYCSLCKCMGKRFGVLSRLTLSYDATFLAMLALSLKDDCPAFYSGRCVANPLKKCVYCKGGEEALAFSGALSITMTYYKIRDDIQDSGFGGKLRAWCLLPMAAWCHRKTKRQFPEVERIVADCMQEQAAAELDPEAGIDSSAEPTARMLSEVARQLAGEDERKKLILDQFGYFIGRWIYLIDAADDMDKDNKHGAFNPFLKKLVKEREMPLESKELREYCNGVLNQTLARALSAFQLLELSHFDTILQNTMTLGLPAMQKQVLFDKEKEEYDRSLQGTGSIPGRNG